MSRIEPGSKQQPLALSMDHSTDREVEESVSRTQPRSAWWILLGMLSIFLVLCTTTAIRCASSDECTVIDIHAAWNCTANVTCTAYQLPSFGSLLSNPVTSTLAVSAFDMLIAMHILVNINLSIMMRSHSKLAIVLMSVFVVAIYVTLYVSFIVARWYMSIVPITCMMGWSGSVVYGLHHYYRLQASKPLYWVTVASLVAFTIAGLLDIAFLPIPYALFAGRDIGVLVTQLFMGVGCVVFVVSVALHTRAVSYLAQVERAYIVL